MAKNKNSYFFRAGPILVLGSIYQLIQGKAGSYAIYLVLGVLFLGVAFRK
ncbi:hypothetical protein [Streptococcus suis]|nr:hypothetical protein [Streptococcus suis]